MPNTVIANEHKMINKPTKIFKVKADIPAPIKLVTEGKLIDGKWYSASFINNARKIAYSNKLVDAFNKRLDEAILYFNNKQWVVVTCRAKVDIENPDDWGQKFMVVVKRETGVPQWFYVCAAREAIKASKTALLGKRDLCLFQIDIPEEVVGLYEFSLKKAFNLNDNELMYKPIDIGFRSFNKLENSRGLTGKVLGIYSAVFLDRDLAG